MVRVGFWTSCWKMHSLTEATQNHTLVARLWNRSSTFRKALPKQCVDLQFCIRARNATPDRSHAKSNIGLMAAGFSFCLGLALPLNKIL